MATLIVGSWYSKCGECQRSCNPRESHHNTVLGYGKDNGSAGCGAEFTEMQSEYTGLAAERGCMDLRPDLDLICYDTKTWQLKTIKAPHSPIQLRLFDDKDF